MSIPIKKISYQAPNTNKRIHFFYKSYDEKGNPLKSKKNRPLSLFKYINLDSAVSCLKNDSIVFAEPICWDDEYESRFYSAVYDNISLDSIGGFVPKPLFSCCFATTMYSEPSWKVYTYGKQGLGHKCIQLELDFSKFIAALSSAVEKIDYSVYCGYVSYLPKWKIDGLHYSDNSDYDSIFNDFTIDDFLSLLLLKRDAYKYEDEYRIFIVPNKKDSFESIDKSSILPGENKRLLLKIKWCDIIKEIKYDSSFSVSEVEILRTFCKGANINFIEDKNVIDLYDALNKYRKEEESLKDFTQFRYVNEYKLNTNSLLASISTKDDLLAYIQRELLLPPGAGEYENVYETKYKLDERIVLLSSFDINKMSGDNPITIGTVRQKSYYDLLIQYLKEWQSHSAKAATRKP